MVELYREIVYFGFCQKDICPILGRVHNMD
jgi:hypothetical protein